MPLLKCELCGKYFVPKSRNDKKYCDFYNADYPNKTCKEASNVINVKKKTHNDEVTKLSKKVYDRLRSRAVRFDTEENKQLLVAFQQEKDRIKENIKIGKQTETDLIEWLRIKEKETK